MCAIQLYDAIYTRPLYRGYATDVHGHGYIHVHSIYDSTFFL